MLWSRGVQISGYLIGSLRELVPCVAETDRADPDELLRAVERSPYATMNVPRILGPAHPTRPRRSLVSDPDEPLPRRAPPVWDVAKPVAFERSRRQLLREGLAGFGMLLAAPIVSGCGSRDIQFLSDVISNIPNLGSLQGPDANGLMLPPGFTSRVVARTNERPIASSSYYWHRSPDGAAVFETSDGGWV